MQFQCSRNNLGFRAINLEKISKCKVRIQKYLIIYSTIALSFECSGIEIRENQLINRFRCIHGVNSSEVKVQYLESHLNCKLVMVFNKNPIQFKVYSHNNVFSTLHIFNHKLFPFGTSTARETFNNYYQTILT